MTNDVDPEPLMTRLQNSFREGGNSRENLQLSQRSDANQPHLPEGLGCTGAKNPLGNPLGPKPLTARVQISVREFEDSWENLQLSQRSDENKQHFPEGLGCTGTRSPTTNDVRCLLWLGYKIVLGRSPTRSENLQFSQGSDGSEPATCQRAWGAREPEVPWQTISVPSP